MEERKILIADRIIGISTIGGNAKLPPIVFLHGWRSNRTVWYPLCEKLKRSHTLVAIDLPGFGESENPAHPYSVLDYGTVVYSCIEKLGIKKAHLVGHSFGGRIAIKLAAFYPNFIQSLVLTGSAGIRKPSVKRTLIKIGAHLTRPLMHIGLMKGFRTYFYTKIGSGDYLATPALQETYALVLEEDLTRHLSHIKAPTLLYWGRDDTETPLSFGEIMKKEIPQSRLLVRKGGHFAFLENLDDFSQVVMTFQKQNE